MTEDNTVLRAEKVFKSYRQGERELEVLRDLDFSIKKGEFIVILGPSGSGKTTLLNLIGGIDVPTRGKIYIDNQELSGFNEKELTLLRREKIGFVFQFFNLLPSLTAMENIEFSKQIKSSYGKKNSQDKYSSEDLLKMVELYERRDHFPSQLSGGEQQRVAIARSVANDPEIILCDEPTGELDYKTGRKIVALLKKLNREAGKTTVIVTHNSVIGKTADRIFYLHGGEIDDIKDVSKPEDPLGLEW